MINLNTNYVKTKSVYVFALKMFETFWNCCYVPKFIRLRSLMFNVNGLAIKIIIMINLIFIDKVKFSVLLARVMYIIQKCMGFQTKSSEPGKVLFLPLSHDYMIVKIYQVARILSKKSHQPRKPIESKTIPRFFIGGHPRLQLPPLPCAYVWHKKKKEMKGKELSMAQTINCN